MSLETKQEIIIINLPNAPDKTVARITIVDRVKYMFYSALLDYWDFEQSACQMVFGVLLKLLISFYRIIIVVMNICVATYVFQYKVIRC